MQKHPGTAGEGHVQAVAGRGRIAEIEYGGHGVRAASAQERIQAGSVGLAVQPLKTCGVILALPKGVVGKIQAVQLFRKMAERIVDGVLQQHPIQFPGFVPFAHVAKLAAHKVQLFTRMRHHIQVQRPRLRKFLFVIPVHFLHDGCFAVDHLVVGKREKILFLRKVRHGKRQLVVLCPALLRRFFEIVQRVVHPAQVPLVVEAQPAVFHRSSHLGKIGGILCDEHRCGMQTPQAGIHCLQK